MHPARQPRIRFGVKVNQGLHCLLPIVTPRGRPFIGSGHRFHGRSYNGATMMEAETAAKDEAARLIATPGLQQLLDRFAQEHFLRFEEPVANLFEFLTSNTIRSSDESFLGEEDLTAFIAEALERSEEHTSELQSPCNLVCRLLLEK